MPSATPPEWPKSSYIPLGQFFQPTAWRRSVQGVLKGPTLFWNIRRAA
jgi:peptide/nickel transport system substrate-binding protein